MAKRRPDCAWCPTSTPSVTDLNIQKGRKLQLVPVCGKHRDMIEREKAEREREAAAKKEPFVPWW